MTILKAANRQVLSILLAAAACTANAEEIADGIAWTNHPRICMWLTFVLYRMCCPQVINTMRNISLGNKILSAIRRYKGSATPLCSKR